jgi:uncharacterized membrane-anchored protein
MKDLKSKMTMWVVSTLCIIAIITVVADVLPFVDDLKVTDGVFALFNTATGAIISYYFTRKSQSSVHCTEENDQT